MAKSSAFVPLAFRLVLKISCKYFTVCFAPAYAASITSVKPDLAGLYGFKFHFGESNRQATRSTSSVSIAF